MASIHKTLGIVLAGGQGTRLHALTHERCKPAVPFNGKHRLVDFVLSNLLNSGLTSVHLLVQYQAQSLVEHVRQAWSSAPYLPPHFVKLVPPAPTSEHGYLGTSDAVWQNIRLIEEAAPDHVAVFGADHVYRMDLRQMLDAHVRNRADVTVATVPVPCEHCSGFGIVETDAQLRITDFREKPQQTRGMASRATHALASMGNYLFSTEVLLRELRRGAEAGETDFGTHLLPRLVKGHRLLAYDFAENQVPGTHAFEEPAYWRDVGTIDAYFDAHLDTLGVQPRFRMTNPQWPIYGSQDASESAQIEAGLIRRSVVGSGCVVDGARLDHATLRRAVHLQPGAELDHCIVMDRCVIGAGASLRRVIVDQDNHVPPGERIGHDEAYDRMRFHVSPSGVVVVPRGHFRRPA